jgi:exodeoxyribonuclease-3
LGAPLLVVGDLNIVDDRPCSQYARLYDFERRAYSGLIDSGLTDLLAGTEEFSWYSNQGVGFRFDHALASEHAVSLVTSVRLDQSWRTRQPKLTDHAAIALLLNLTYESAKVPQAPEYLTLF